MSTERLLRRAIVLSSAAVSLSIAGCSASSETPSGTTDDDENEAVSSAVVASHDDGAPLVVQGLLSRVRLRAGADRERVLAVVADVASLLKAAASDLDVAAQEQDELGFSHVRLTERHDGIPVVGSEVIVHADALGRVFQAMSDLRGDAVRRPRPSPQVAAEDARAKALAPYSGGDVEAKDPRLVYVRAEGRGLVLAWETEVEGALADEPVHERLYVDAHAGDIVERHPLIHTALSRSVYDARNRQTLPGTLARSEGGAASSDSVVNGSYANLKDTYDCYRTLFGRDSYNGRGASLKSTVHYGSRYNNAFWNGSQMVYGDGDGTTFVNFATSYDVTTHELTHAVTQSTANLTYSREPGALNEAMSDIFAAVCEAWKRGGVNADTWKVGEGVYTPRTSGDALRYMDDPTRDGQSTDYYPTRYTGSQDNGGVHLNSGIANLAFKLLTTGGRHPRAKTQVNVTGVGIDKAGQIFYRALTRYLTSSSSFKGARTATVQAATDLYGAGAAASVNQAWDAVGVPR